MSWWQTAIGMLGKIPIQGRIERWKNSIDQLEKEKAQLLEGTWDAKKAARMCHIIGKLTELRRLLKNKAGED